MTEATVEPRVFFRFRATNIFCEEDYLDLMFSADLIRLETHQEE